MLFKNKYSHTRAACYIGFVTQAMVCCFMPLLFTIFNEFYGISLIKLTFITTINFLTQLVVDLLSVFFVKRVGHRGCAVLAHIFVAAGFLCLGLCVSGDMTYVVIMLSCIIFSLGGGLLEVIINPISESCPSEHKASSMSILHSMFSIGSILVVLVSALFFKVLGKGKWQLLCILMAFIPILNAVYFSLVPIAEIQEEKRLGASEILKTPIFWLFSLLMFAGGAAEAAMSQWASAFAEVSLGISKVLGDVLGPCMFAAMMALSRITYPMISKKIKLRYYMFVCGIICIASYLTAALSPKYMALLGCSICGFSVGLFWPGTISLAIGKIKGGSVAFFAFLALAGDLGCTTGPTLVGLVSSISDGSLKAGLLAAAVFPLIVCIGLIPFLRKSK